MKARPAFQFYPSDWLRDPGLRSCSLAARGLWIDLLSFMHEAEPYGHLRLNDHDVGIEALGRMMGTPAKQLRKYLDELEAAGVYSRTETGTIFSRRMVRDQELRMKRGEYGHLSQRNPAVPRKKDGGKDTFQPSITPSLQGSPSSSSSSSSSEKKEKIAGSTSSSPATGISPKRSTKMADEEFIAELKKNLAYAGIDIDREIGRIQAWLLTPKGQGKKLTRQRVVTWLNKIDVPLNGHARPLTCMKRIQKPGDRFFRDCGQPASPESQSNEPRCAEHQPKVPPGAVTC